MRGQTLVKGHTLAYEGKPYNLSGYRVKYSRVGHARCSCGEFSLLFSSDAERKRWHGEHKASVAREAAKLDAAKGGKS
jgi:hypothetical protein